MQARVLLKSSAIALLVTALSAGATTEKTEADLILVNGEIQTPGGWQQAMALKDGVIVATGSNNVQALKGAGTEVLDLKGATVLPGLHDMHVHPVFAGTEQYTCGFTPGAGPEEIAAAVADCVAEKEPGEWIEGGNWVAAVFEPGQQNRDFLDKVAPDNPVVLSDESHHSIWVNSAALEKAGIDADTPDPEGGIIERDSNGEATGLLRETATYLVEDHMPPKTMAENRRGLTLATNQMLSYGITSFTVAAIRGNELQLLSDLSRENVIKQRVRGCIAWAPQPEERRHSAEKLLAARTDFETDRFQPDCVKLFLDGVPTESHTGAMLQPYADSHGKDDDRPARGILMIPQDVLDAAVTDFDRQGLHVKFHAAGDAAVHAALDAIEAARKHNGWTGPRHDVGHSTFVSKADIPRVVELQSAWEFSPYIWYPTPMAAVDVANAVGEKRMKRWLPIREALKTDALVVAGSDWSVVPSVNPWLAIETIVTREMPGGSEEALGKDEAITLDDAMRIFTANGASLMGHRDQVGSLEVGMRGDFVITERNPYKVPTNEIHATRVRMTFIDGEKVFDIDNPPRLTAD